MEEEKEEEEQEEGGSVQVGDDGKMGEDNTRGRVIVVWKGGTAMRRRFGLVTCDGCKASNNPEPWRWSRSDGTPAESVLQRRSR